jgi:signal peptidase II
VRVLYLSLVVLVCDQVSKLLVKGIHLSSLGISWEGMPYGSSKQILGDFFRLTYIENPGMAFGIDIGGRLFFSIFSVVAGIAILWYLYRHRTGPLILRIALALIFAGAVGNLIDRVFYGILFGDAPLFYGRVVDFFDVDFFDVTILGYNITRFFVFNVADASVTVGVFLLLLFHRPHVEPEVPTHSLQASTSTVSVNAANTHSEDPPQSFSQPSP